jgi:hypothetical protein
MKKGKTNFYKLKVVLVIFFIHNASIENYAIVQSEEFIDDFTDGIQDISWTYYQSSTEITLYEANGMLNGDFSGGGSDWVTASWYRRVVWPVVIDVDFSFDFPGNAMGVIGIYGTTDDNTELTFGIRMRDSWAASNAFQSIIVYYPDGSTGHKEGSEVYPNWDKIPTTGTSGHIHIEMADSTEFTTTLEYFDGLEWSHSTSGIKMTSKIHLTVVAHGDYWNSASKWSFDNYYENSVPIDQLESTSNQINQTSNQINQIINRIGSGEFQSVLQIGILMTIGIGIISAFVFYRKRIKDRSNLKNKQVSSENPFIDNKQVAFSIECPNCHHPAFRVDIFCSNCGNQLI